MWKYISSFFISGLVVIIPLFITFTIFQWIFLELEGFSRIALLWVIPKAYYYPGMGAAIAIGLIFAIGILNRAWVAHYIIDGLDYIMRKIPIVSSIYTPLTDMAKVMDGKMSEKLGQPVMVQLPHTDVEMLGFITCDNLRELPQGFIDNREHTDGASPYDTDKVAVYVQWGYQVGGFTILIPRSRIRPVNITAEEGLRWSLSAGLSLHAHNNDKSTSVAIPALQE